MKSFAIFGIAAFFLIHQIKSQSTWKDETYSNVEKYVRKNRTGHNTEAPILWNKTDSSFDIPLRQNKTGSNAEGYVWESKIGSDSKQNVWENETQLDDEKYIYTKADDQTKVVEKTKKDCKQWVCDDKVPDEWCYKYNSEDKKIHVGKNDKNKTSCYILHFFETGLLDLKKNKAGYPVETKTYFDAVQKKLCQGRDWQKSAKCDQFCEKGEKYKKNITDSTGKVVQKELTDYKCDFDKYTKAHNHTEKGLRDWSECEYDHQCSSKHCECTPNSQNTKGRCTTSVYDDEYKNFWEHVCEDRDSDKDWEQTNCENFIQILYGHVTVAIDKDQKNLPCLSSFSDFKQLLKLQEELEKLDNSVRQYLLWIIGGCIVSLLCCCVCCATQKEKIKEKFQKRGSSQQPFLGQNEVQYT